MSDFYFEFHLSNCSSRNGYPAPLTNRLPFGVLAHHLHWLGVWTRHNSKSSLVSTWSYVFLRSQFFIFTFKLFLIWADVEQQFTKYIKHKKKWQMLNIRIRKHIRKHIRIVKVILSFYNSSKLFKEVLGEHLLLWSCGVFPAWTWWHLVC